MLNVLRKVRISRVHRWLGIGLAPVILLILVSGIVLAVRPMRGSSHQAIDVARLRSLVGRLDADSRVRSLNIDRSRTNVSLDLQSGAPASVFDIATGNREVSPRAETRDAFDLAEDVHNDLGIGMGWLASLGSLALVIIVGVAPFMARQARGGTPLGTHVRTAWLLLPLVLYLPLTLVLMQMELPRREKEAPVIIPMATALAQASAQMDLGALVTVRTLRGWTYLVVNNEQDAPRRYRLEDGVVKPLKNPLVTFARTMHEGTWGGIWGGVLNIVSALLLLWMMATGLWSFVARRRLRRERRSRSAGELEASDTSARADTVLDRETATV